MVNSLSRRLFRKGWWCGILWGFGVTEFPNFSHPCWKSQTTLKETLHTDISVLDYTYINICTKILSYRYLYLDYEFSSRAFLFKWYIFTNQNIFTYRTQNAHKIFFRQNSTVSLRADLVRRSSRVLPFQASPVDQTLFLLNVGLIKSWREVPHPTWKENLVA